jgi:hypothetical protein
MSNSALRIEAVVWMEQRGVGPTTSIAAIYGLAKAIGLLVMPEPGSERPVSLEVAGGGDEMARFLAGLALRGAAIVRSQQVPVPQAEARRVLIHLGGAPEAPFSEM